MLEVKDLSAKGFEHVSFDLHAGEILGVAGQLGSGRTELSLALFGMLKPTGGSICISGKEVQLKMWQRRRNMASRWFRRID